MRSLRRNSPSSHVAAFFMPFAINGSEERFLHRDNLSRIVSVAAAAAAANSGSLYLCPNRSNSSSKTSSRRPIQGDDRSADRDPTI